MNDHTNTRVVDLLFSDPDVALLILRFRTYAAIASHVQLAYAKRRGIVDATRLEPEALIEARHILPTLLAQEVAPAVSRVEIKTHLLRLAARLKKARGHGLVAPDPATGTRPIDLALRLDVPPGRPAFYEQYGLDQLYPWPDPARRRKVRLPDDPRLFPFLAIQEDPLETAWLCEGFPTHDNPGHDRALLDALKYVKDREERGLLKIHRQGRPSKVLAAYRRAPQPDVPLVAWLCGFLADFSEDGSGRDVIAILKPRGHWNMPASLRSRMSLSEASRWLVLWDALERQMSAELDDPASILRDYARRFVEGNRQRLANAEPKLQAARELEKDHYLAVAVLEEILNGQLAEPTRARLHFFGRSGDLNDGERPEMRRASRIRGALANAAIRGFQCKRSGERVQEIKVEMARRVVAGDAPEAPDSDVSQKRPRPFTVEDWRDIVAHAWTAASELPEQVRAILWAFDAVLSREGAVPDAEEVAELLEYPSEDDPAFADCFEQAMAHVREHAHRHWRLRISGE